MAASKKSKEVKQARNPRGKQILQGGKPKDYGKKYPTWCFNNVDKEKWPFTQENIGEKIWTEILPKLQEFETQTWNEILISSKKQNHSIDVDNLSKAAKDRLAEKFIEEESLISLHLTGKHRIYGYMSFRAGDPTFMILWYDDEHGDNEDCVCRSHVKHT